MKGASEDANDHFQFNHVRKDKEYDYLLLIGIRPAQILWDVYTKEEVVLGSAGTLTPMGKNQGGVGDEGTFKITKTFKDLLKWNDTKLHPKLAMIFEEDTTSNQ